MSEHDAIKTMGTLPAKLQYLIEFSEIGEGFEGTDATSWFWACLDAIKLLIEEWHILDRPRYIRIYVRRELEDKGSMPWILVKDFKLELRTPWIDIDAFEQEREFLYMIGQALGLAWRNRDALAIAQTFKPEAFQNPPGPNNG